MICPRVVSADLRRDEIGCLLKVDFLLWNNVIYHVAVIDYSLGSEVNWDQREDQAHKESWGQGDPQESKEQWVSKGNRVCLELQERRVSR